mmetsp:Transcript_14129/g.22729  ORF Transcript_14129/g.22729 Transcript_14129/m.22729 type:complete len:241 (+) Transcript_14129:429-1151(+)
MSLMKDVVSLNNQGVSYLARRDFPQAIDALRQAIVLAKRSCRVLSANGAQTSTKGNQVNETCRRSPQELPKFLCKSNGSLNDDLGGFHSSGILLDYCSDLPEDAELTSATVIFNMACAFHTKSIAQFGCQEEMDKAKSLYMHVHQLVSGLIVRGNGGNNEVAATGNFAIDFLYLAIVNNMAYAELDVFGDKTKSAALFQRLALFSLSCREKCLGEETLLEWFLQNAVFAQVGKLITAPAA